MTNVTYYNRIANHSFEHWAQSHDKCYNQKNLTVVGSHRTEKNTVMRFTANWAMYTNTARFHYH